MQEISPPYLQVRAGETAMQATRRIIDRNLEEYEKTHKTEVIDGDGIVCPHGVFPAGTVREGVQRGMMADAEWRPSMMPEAACKPNPQAVKDKGKVEDPLLETLKGMKLRELLDKNDLTDMERAILTDLLRSKGDIVVLPDGIKGGAGI
jgi:hypothetical protein